MLSLCTRCRNFQALSTAGLDPNTAAAYSLKWASKTAEPIDVSVLPAAPPRISEDGLVPRRAPQQLPEAVEQQLLQLFRSGDSLYLTLVLHFHKNAAHAQPDARADEDAATTAVEPLVDLDQLTGLYAGAIGASQEPSARSAPVADTIRALVREKLPGSLTWNPATGQAAILAALMLLPHFAEVRPPHFAEVRPPRCRAAHHAIRQRPGA
jgi:hypothetical protein